MPELATRSDYLREVYFPTVYYTEVLDYTLKEIESEQAAFKELDNLILKANANTARLADVHRERLLHQKVSLRDAYYAVDQYREEVAAAGRAAQNTANNPGAAGKAKLEDLNVGVTDNRTLAQNAVEVAEKYARRYDNEALARLAYKQIIEQVGGDLVADNRATLLAKSVQRTFGEGKNYNAIVAETNSKADKDARARHARSAGTPKEDLQAIADDPSKPADVRKAASSIIASESEYAHGRKESGLEPGQEKLAQLFLNKLRDDKTPGQALASEFDSPEQYAEARAAYETARDSAAYFKTDAEWYQFDYLSAVQEACP
jgi:hypothetical protein